MWHHVRSVDGLHQLIDDTSKNASAFLCFKHSPRCSLSAMALNRMERKPFEGIQYAMIDVIAHRDVTDALSKWSGVRHESPQCFLIHKGKVEMVQSHLQIRPEVFSDCLRELQGI